MEQIIHIGLYHHYKGQLYEVLGVGKHADTHEDIVVYRGLYKSVEFGCNPLWVRPKKDFLDDIVVEGIAMPRFLFVGGKFVK